MEGKSPIEKMSIREHLIWLRNEFSDEIPATILHSNMPNNKFKVRRNWFTGVVADLENAINYEGLKDAETIAEIKRFITYAISEDFGNKLQTDAGDIEWANRVIDMAVEKLPDIETKHNKLEQLLERAVVWAQEQSRVALEAGTLLSDQELKLAKSVGVEHPELVRILEVDAIPVPNDPELRAKAQESGLLNPDTAGITFGHGIFILKGHRTNRLTSHELRHVYQYEQAGSIPNFLSSYISQLLSAGYAKAPLELDAQKYEQK